MTQLDTVDAIMEVMQNFVNAERKKIWELAQKQSKVELEARIVQLVKGLKNYGAHLPNCKICLSPPKSFRLCSCGFDEALNGSKELSVWSDIQKAFPFGHRYDCSCGTSDCKVIPCNCGLHDALSKTERDNDE